MLRVVYDAVNVADARRKSGTRREEHQPSKNPGTLQQDARRHDSRRAFM
jgi:hypothetical protein